MSNREVEPWEERPPSNERLYLTGEITSEELSARIDEVAAQVAARDLAPPQIEGEVTPGFPVPTITDEITTGVFSEPIEDQDSL